MDVRLWHDDLVAHHAQALTAVPVSVDDLQVLLDGLVAVDDLVFHDDLVEDGETQTDVDLGEGSCALASLYEVS